MKKLILVIGLLGLLGTSAHADVTAVAADLTTTAGTVVTASAGVITAGLGMFAVKFGGSWLVRMIKSFVS